MLGHLFRRSAPQRRASSSALRRRSTSSSQDTNLSGCDPYSRRPLRPLRPLLRASFFCHKCGMRSARSCTGLVFGERCFLLLGPPTEGLLDISAGLLVPEWRVPGVQGQGSLCTFLGIGLSDFEARLRGCCNE